MDTKISRRTLLCRTVTVTAGVVAVSAMNVAATQMKIEETTIVFDHDRATGEISDRDRHHHWDTV